MNNKNSFVHTDFSPLQLHWAEQFANESEQAIDAEDMPAVARTVLFYAGLQLEMMFPPASIQPFPVKDAAAQDWLLAPEEEIVRALPERDPQADRRLLHLALLAVKPAPLSIEERHELRARAAVYIRSIGERLRHFTEQWLH
ncbi:hypothetical protein [Paenibacillus piri]|uniref:Uncharacterized protein n=1 Tax=Paenibacillus piri TaxID=2547395 RepID=A0A4R5KGM9_9BACL|nr:hypothetical protein [Paenibacillus piri]TDF93858.1 hypothetical protein E1757_26100 [Paenibacillus piri]